MKIFQILSMTMPLEVSIRTCEGVSIFDPHDAYDDSVVSTVYENVSDVDCNDVNIPTLCDTTNQYVNENVHHGASTDNAVIRTTGHLGEVEIDMKYPSKSDTLRICSWNIEGLNDEKLHIVGNFLRQFDIILLSETWCHADDVYHFSGYTFVNFARKEKHPDAIRMSGGLAFSIKMKSDMASR